MIIIRDMMNLITKETQRKTAVRVLSAAVFVLLAAGCIFAGAGAAAQTGFDGGIMWELTDEGLLKISPAIEQTESGYSSGQMKDYQFDTESGYPSTAPWIPYRDNFNKLEIKPGVTTIGKEAFRGCNKLTSELQIPDSVTEIGVRAFFDCTGFTGLTLGSSVTTIGTDAFKNCSGFTGSLSIPNSVMTIGDEAFYSCSGFTGPLTLGSSVKTIGERAFSSCSGFTGPLTIPDSVTTIGTDAFYNCTGFTGLTLGSSVTTIGTGAFTTCSSLSIIYIEGDLSSLDGMFPAAVPLAKTNGGRITKFEDATLLFEEAQQVFDEAPLLYLVAPLLLEDATLLSTPVREEYTFAGWYTTSDFSGPSVTEYEPSGRYYAKWILLYGGIKWSASDGILTISPVDKPESGYSRGQMKDGEDAPWKSVQGLRTLVIEDGVTTIGERAFSGCSGFTGPLTIPDTVKTIGHSAFEGCSGFTSLTIGSYVQTNGIYAFEGYRGYTSFVNWIGERAFYGCGLTNPVTIPSDVTTLDNDSLAGQVRAGYTFGGWYDNSAYSGDPVASYAAGKTYYPKWMLKHNITVSSDGHGDVSAPESAAEGTIVHLITKPHDGYEFDKWDVIKGDISIENNEFTMPASDVEIRATFTPINYTVTYDGNGASGGQVPAAQTCAYGSSITVSGNTGNLTKDGFKFVGWNTKSDGTGQDYKPDDSLTVKGAVVLYADWVIQTKHTIYISTDGGGTASSDPPGFLCFADSEA